MALSYPQTPPAGIRRLQWMTESAVAVARAETTFVAQKQVFQGMRWVFEVELATLELDDAKDWKGFLAGLNGQEGSFLLGDPAGASPRGVATGTPLVAGASQTGRELDTDGWTTSVTGILKRGDYFQLGSGASARLHMVTADADSDGSGAATLEIWPQLRSAPADNAALTLADPVGVFRLASNQAVVDTDEAQLSNARFLVVEDL